MLGEWFEWKGRKVIYLEVEKQKFGRQRLSGPAETMGHGVDSDPSCQISPIVRGQILPDISGDRPVLEIGFLSQCFK